MPSGSGVFWDTVIDARISQTAPWADKWVEALKSIPTLSVVMPEADLFGPSGIHRGANLENRTLEKPTSVEYSTRATRPARPSRWTR